MRHLDAGVAGVEVSSWSGFLVPARTPGEIVAKIHDDTAKALAESAVRDKLETTGAVVVASSPAELGSFIAAELDKWGQIIKAANIRAE